MLQVYSLQFAHENKNTFYITFCMENQRPHSRMALLGFVNFHLVYQLIFIILSNKRSSWG